VLFSSRFQFAIFAWVRRSVCLQTERAEMFLKLPRCPVMLPTYDPSFLSIAGGTIRNCIEMHVMQGFLLVRVSKTPTRKGV
jgi:hypothetical protein